MERYEQPCGGRMRIFVIWGLYALAVTVLSRYIAERGLPDLVGWGAGLALGLAVLVWIRDV
jgi:hypothetical protein